MASGSQPNGLSTRRSRCWCLTINNYDLEHVSSLKELKTAYLIIGDETGDSGTPHLQIYFRLLNPCQFSSIKRKFPTAHIEIAKGTDLENKSYCTKQSTMYESGEPSAQGKRTDIDDIKRMLTDGANLRDIVPLCRSVQSIRHAEIHLKYFEQKRSWKPEVFWYYGPTGTGKSWSCHSQCTDPYVCLHTGQWWEGYDGHEDVIIDDMRADFCKFHVLLKLLDRYPVTVECKGGSRQFLARRIFITSCYHPKRMYHQTEECVEQLMRRITHIVEHTEKYESKPQSALFDFIKENK